MWLDSVCVTSKPDTRFKCKYGRQEGLNRKTLVILPANLCVVTHVPFPGGLPQKTGINPDTGQHQLIKYVKGVSCVDHLSSVQFVPNVPIFAPDLAVGARLHNVWEKWAALGVSPKVIAVLKEDSTLLVPAKSDKVTHHYKLLCKSPHEQLSHRGIACT